MTASDDRPSLLLVAGVPDTPEIWTDMLAAPALAATITHRPAAPGFGAPLPWGFDPTADGYVAWLLAQAADIAAATGRPIDLVGHDWGGAWVWRTAALRPDLVRRWTVIGAPVWPDYRWHPAARIWRTALLGELAMLGMRGRAVARALERFGLPPALAASEAAAVDADMRRAILRLYRSADVLAARWRASTPPAERGLLIMGARDPFVPIAAARRFAADGGLALHVEETGHWPMVERPDAVAARLAAHLA